MTGDEEKPSKTQRKKAVQALQDLGEELTALNDGQLAGIALPERLRDAVTEARRMTSFEARRRQLQYIGKLMRGIDAAPIRAALEAVHARSRGEAATHKRAEAWRERLLSGPGGLDELRAEHPETDTRRLRALIDAAMRERAEGRPPRAFRELYHALRALIGRP